MSASIYYKPRRKKRKKLVDEEKREKRLVALSQDFAETSVPISEDPAEEDFDDEVILKAMTIRLWQ